MNDESIFDRARGITDPQEREQFLAQMCGENITLRQEVESLLAAHFAADNPLDGGPATGEYTPQPSVESGATTDATGAVGTIIGPYKLLQKLGEGGMGDVWVAEQEQPVKRRVALKLIKAGMDSTQVLRRFEAERQALALMDHTNIARVLDAGTTPNGRPYFAMELVKGVPITKYCDELHLSLRERMELFVPICQAIQHAHQKGIIHRDIKPSNVLVAVQDGKPVPKVIDFGVAKAIQQRLTEQSMYTEVGAVIGTLEYMSPEQAELSALDIDTRADVYALGVLLYELLTGSTPIDRKRLKQAAFVEALRIIKEEEPSKPSTRLTESKESIASLAAMRRTEPAKLTKALRGELDWIVMKCLEKDRTRRYETANGLARDIQRHLSDEAVEACPPSSSYRLKKFVRRNRGAVIAASLVFFALLGGLAMLYAGIVTARYGLQRARDAEQAARADQEEAKEQRDIALEQRARAEKARDRTADVLDAMTSSITGDSLTTQREVSAEQRKFLNQVLSYYREFSSEKSDDEASRARAASAAHRLGRIEDKLGHFEQAKIAFQAACEAYRALAAEFPDKPQYRQELTANQMNLGFMLRHFGQRAEGERQYRQALSIQAKLVADDPNATHYRNNLANIHNQLGTVLVDLGKRSEALDHHRQAMGILEKLVADVPTSPEFRRDLSRNQFNLGLMLIDLGKPLEALELYAKGLANQKKLAGDFPLVMPFRSELARGHHYLGLLYTSLGMPAEAEEHLRQAQAIQRKLAADFPTAPDHRLHWAASQASLGNLLASLGKEVEAEEQYRQNLAILQKLCADFPTVPEYRRRLAVSHNNLGLLADDYGKKPEAEVYYRQSLELLQKLETDFPNTVPYREDLAGTLGNLATSLSGLGKHAEAEKLFRQSLAISTKLVTDHPSVVKYRKSLTLTQNNLANLLQRTGKQAEAADLYRQVLTFREKLVADFPKVPDYQVDLGGSYCNLGGLFRDGKRANESLVWFDKAITMLTPIHQGDPRLLTARQFLRNSHWSRAIALDMVNRHVEALKDWDRAIELSAPNVSPSMLSSRAASRLKAGMAAEAVAELAELTKSSKWNAGEWYNFACIYAVASNKVADKKEEYSERAMELLQLAVKAGFREPAHMKTDTDLDSLREREDFKNLIAELEKEPAKAAEKP